MAKTGSISFSYKQDTAKNQSTVTVSGIIKTSGESYRGDSRTGTYTIKRGSTTLASGSFTHGAPQNSTTTLFTKEVVVTHNDEGKSEAITASYNYDSGWCSASGSLSLPTIARKSTLTVANGTLGTEQTLTINEKASAFNHKLTYSCGSASGYILGSASGTSSEASKKWTPPIDLAAQNTTGTSVSITFTLYTYSGSTLIGSNAYTKTFAIPTQLSDGTKIAPSCTIAVSDYTGYASKYGGYIKNISRLNVSITETKSYGSAINTYTTTANGTTYKTASFVTELLKTAGNMTITSTVTDKRGRSGSDTETINVLDYTAPAVTALSVHRCNADGTENEQGEYVKATFSASVTSLGGLNSASYAIEFRKTTEEEKEPTPLPISDYSVSNHEYIFEAETESSYYVKVYAMDDFDKEHGTKETTVSTARTLLDFYGDRAIAIGKVCEVDEGFEVGLQSYMREDAYIEKNLAFYKHETEEVQSLIQHEESTDRMMFKDASRGYSFDAPVMLGNKTGYHDGQTGIYINPDGYIHIQRATDGGTLHPYLAFYLDNATTYGGIIRHHSGTNRMQFLNAEYYEFDNALLFQNGMPIVIKNASGALRNCFHLNAKNNLVIGHGTYENKEGNTDIYGYNIRLFDSYAGSNLRPYYRKGDSFSVQLETAGYITSSKTEIYFHIPFSKPIMGSPTITVSGTLKLRQGNSYTHGSASGTAITPDSYKVYVKEGLINVTATESTVTNATNNDSIGIFFNGTVTFS